MGTHYHSCQYHHRCIVRIITYSNRLETASELAYKDLAHRHSLSGILVSLASYFGLRIFTDEMTAHASALS